MWLGTYQFINMHSKIIEDANLEQLKGFAFDVFNMLKRTVDRDVYKDIEMDLYIDVYGHHFTKWLLDKALYYMENEDGTKGGHWNVEQTTMVARSNGIDFKDFNEYDWNYVMNMIYSDYYGSVPNETSVYVKMARKFLEDKDAEDGKALKYYLALGE